MKRCISSSSRNVSHRTEWTHGNTSESICFAYYAGTWIKYSSLFSLVFFLLSHSFPSNINESIGLRASTCASRFKRTPRATGKHIFVWNETSLSSARPKVIHNYVTCSHRLVSHTTSEPGLERERIARDNLVRVSNSTYPLSLSLGSAQNGANALWLLLLLVRFFYIKIFNSQMINTDFYTVKLLSFEYHVERQVSWNFLIHISCWLDIDGPV